ncbi:hypothetical protein [Streptomyces violaceorubidus]|uniref:Uncharacterized protein n=1 Tax=Streptomyces violaceorubidus TaxID=284042 RepID=A0ABV1T7D9_9ACTN
MGEVFAADVSRIRQWQTLMGDITGITDNVMPDVDAQARSCAGRAGQERATAGELRDRDRGEHDGSRKTGTSMMQAIGRVFRALKVNGSMIQGARNDAYDTDKSGRH